MKRMFSVLISMLLLVAVFTGCSKGKESEAVDEKSQVQEAAVLEGPYDLTGCKAQKVVVATAGGAQNVETLYTEKWMDLVTERSGGLITFDYSNGGAMGSYSELIDGVNAGAYDLTVTDLSYLNTYVPETVIPCMPFVMADYDHLQKVYTSNVFAWLQNCVEEKTHMVLLNTYFCGFREILSKDKLSGLKDFDGYLIRSPQIETYTNMFHTLGFSYVTLSWSDTYTGMQTGVIDSVETALMSLYNTGFYDLGKYVLLTNHMQAINNVVANSEFWNKMPQAYRDIMNDAFSEIQQEEWAKSIENEEFYIEKLKTEGVTVSELTDSDRAAINQAFMPYWKETAEKVGGESANMLEKILSLAK